jgi:hypothetical protein
MGEGAGPGLVGVALLGQKKSPVGQKRIGTPTFATGQANA